MNCYKYWTQSDSVIDILIMVDLGVTASAGLGLSPWNKSTVVSLLASLAATLGVAILPLEVEVHAEVLAMDPLSHQPLGSELALIKLSLCSSSWFDLGPC